MKNFYGFNFQEVKMASREFLRKRLFVIEQSHFRVSKVIPCTLRGLRALQRYPRAHVKRVKQIGLNHKKGSYATKQLGSEMISRISLAANFGHKIKNTRIIA